MSSLLSCINYKMNYTKMVMLPMDVYKNILNADGQQHHHGDAPVILLPINKGEKRPAAIKVGDDMRISRKKRKFQKEHAPTSTVEIFKVKKVDRKPCL